MESQTVEETATTVVETSPTSPKPLPQPETTAAETTTTIAPVVEVGICSMLSAPASKKRHKVTMKKLSKYIRQRNRKTVESDIFKWREFDDEVYDSEKECKIAGGLDFYGCKLLTTIDSDDPAMYEGKKMFKVRWIPSTLTFIFYPKDDYRSARIYSATLSPLKREQV